MNAENEIRYWQEKTCVQMMADMGIKPGDTVIDFGCSIGNYSIPLAYAVGAGGKVYAVDISSHVLSKVRAEAGKRGLGQVETVCPAYEDRLEFQDGSVDAVLIYDLIHALGRSRDRIIKECRRVLCSGGILSVLPFHMSEREKEKTIGLIPEFGFCLNDIQRGGGVHFEMQMYAGSSRDGFESFERGDIYNFRKLER